MNNVFLTGQLQCQEVVSPLSLNKKGHCVINSFSNNEKRLKEEIYL